jgi:hypothetical protein
MKRIMVIAVLLLGSMAVSPAATSAHANKIKWNVYSTQCHSYNQRATGWIKEQGTTGTTWMRVWAYFQRWNGYSWVTTKRSYVQSRRQFRNDHGDHQFSWTKTFNYRGADFTRATRILFWFQWFRNNDLLYQRSRASRTCYP